jgi:hypothetical protein
MLSLEDAWIKAAVEHNIINIDYFSARTKRENTNRDIEPDFVGTSRNGRNNGFWATFCHLRHQGPRCFQPNTVRRFNVTSKTFTPSIHGRWQELVPLYNARGLKNKSFGGEIKN